jgi:hypothetical protein
MHRQTSAHSLSQSQVHYPHWQNRAFRIPVRWESPARCHSVVGCLGLPVSRSPTVFSAASLSWTHIAVSSVAVGRLTGRGVRRCGGRWVLLHIADATHFPLGNSGKNLGVSNAVTVISTSTAVSRGKKSKPVEPWWRNLYERSTGTPPGRYATREVRKLVRALQHFKSSIFVPETGFDAG